MKIRILQKVYAAFGMAFLAVLFLSNSSNPNNNLTGAPGENTCAICHSGGSYTGTVTISGIPAQIQLSTTYNVSLCINATSGTPETGGFQLTALNSDNTAAGSYSNFGADVGVNSATVMGANRDYMEHRGDKAFSGGAACWAFDWTSPATSGAVSFYMVGNITNNNSGTSGDVVVTNSLLNVPLPVELARFDAVKKGNTIVLEWETLVEKESSHFEIERSTNGRDYEVIGEVLTAENGGSRSAYQFEDKEAFLFEDLYYRLKMVDQDGSVRYSKIRTVEFDLQYNGLEIGAVYPNPVGSNEQFVMQLYSNIAKPVLVQVIDIRGKAYQRQVQDLTEGVNSIQLSTANLSHGIYNVLVFDTELKKYLQHKIVVN